MGTEITVTLDGRKPVTITFNAATFNKFRHGYAGTIYRGQGRTLDQTYLYHSEHWRSAASYVALTRHRDKAELFVARNTARDVKELARQMARTDERRAASMFHRTQEIATHQLNPAELLADLAPQFGMMGTAGPTQRSTTAAATEGAEPPPTTAEASQRPEIAATAAVAAPDRSRHNAQPTAGGIIFGVLARAVGMLGGLFGLSAENIAPTTPSLDQHEAERVRAMMTQPSTAVWAQEARPAASQQQEVDARLAATLAVMAAPEEKNGEDEQQRQTLQRKRGLSL